MRFPGSTRISGSRSQRAGSVPGVAVTVATPGTFGCPVVRLLTTIAVAVTAVVATGPGVAYGAWRSDAGAASATASAHAIPPVVTPTATNTANDSRVTVAWPAVVYAPGTPVAGYAVRVVDATTGVSRAIGAGCSGRVGTTTCEELHAPDGRWHYAVSAVAGDEWSGPSSPPSTTVTVSAVASPVPDPAVPVKLTVLDVVLEPGAGAVTATVGAVLSIVTVCGAESVMWPAPSTARTATR